MPCSWEWKVQEDRKIADDTLAYELKEYDNYIENDDELKALKKRRQESHKKFILELSKKETDIGKRLAKANAEDEEIDKEVKDHEEEYPDAEIAKENAA